MRQYFEPYSQTFLYEKPQNQFHRHMLDFATNCEKVKKENKDNQKKTSIEVDENAAKDYFSSLRFNWSRPAGLQL